MDERLCIQTRDLLHARSNSPTHIFKLRAISLVLMHGLHELELTDGNVGGLHDLSHVFLKNGIILQTASITMGSVSLQYLVIEQHKTNN